MEFVEVIAVSVNLATVTISHRFVFSGCNFASADFLGRRWFSFAQ
jgi:hypothetical protein